MPPKDAEDAEISKRDTRTESFSSETDPNTQEDQPIVYTEEELEAMQEVRTKLTEEFGIEESRIGLKFLAVATINTKLRVDETATKIQKLLELMESLGCPDGIDDDIWKPEAAHELAPYAACGKDYSGAATTWIVGGGKVPKEEERNHVHASIMLFLANHSDAISLRNGITFILDVSKSPEPPKIGNEGALNAFYQAFPQRPQAILIAGTNVVTRTVVNTSIQVASLFIKQKVLDRIRFVTVDEAKEKLPLSSAPRYVGGDAGGIDSIEKWVEERLEKLPLPKLDYC